MKHLLNSLALWLGLLDTLAHRAGLHGLSWGRGTLGPLLALAGLRGRPTTGALLAGLPLAIPLQAGLAALANPGLDPRRQLAPGDYVDRTVQRLDIPGEYGPIPALHIAPKAGVVGASQSATQPDNPTARQARCVGLSGCRVEEDISQHPKTLPDGGTQAAVCVAHGSGADKTFYAWRLTTALLEQGLAVLLIDLDGHGESPRPQSHPEIIECVAGSARWLSQRYARVGLLGMSLGSAVTARAAAQGAPCAALVLWEAPPRLRMDVATYRRAQIREALRVARPPLMHLFRDGTLYHVVRGWQTSGIRAKVGTWDLFDALDLLGSLGQIKAEPDRPPLLLIYGGRDAVLHQGAEQEARQASAGWGEFYLLPRATHLSLPIEPETINLTAAWLGARLSGGDQPIRTSP